MRLKLLQKGFLNEEILQSRYSAKKKALGKREQAEQARLQALRKKLEDQAERVFSRARVKGGEGIKEILEILKSPGGRHYQKILRDSKGNQCDRSAV